MTYVLILLLVIWIIFVILYTFIHGWTTFFGPGVMDVAGCKGLYISLLTYNIILSLFILVVTICTVMSLIYCCCGEKKDEKAASVPE